MPKQIIPSIIAKNQKEFDDRFEKIKTSSIIHLDIMDGKFVKNKSLNFSLTLPRKKYELHMMVNDPIKYIKWISKYATTIIFHIETCKSDEEVNNVIKLIKSKKKKPAIAINPKTPINKIKPFLKSLNHIVIMTVTPGKYGSKFQPSSLIKAKKLKKLKPKIHIQLDGGINDKTIKKARSFADSFVVGSYIQNSDNSKLTINELKKSI